MNEHASTSKRSDMQENTEILEKLDKRYLQYGCSHYQQKCHIRSHVTMRSLIVDIITMKQRILSMSIPIQRHDVHRHKIQRSSVDVVTLSNMFRKCVLIVGSAWEVLCETCKHTIHMDFLKEMQ